MTRVFHHVTYREADALREAVGLAATRSSLDFLGWVRLCGEWIRETPDRGFGPRCRECGVRIPPAERAIQFIFRPHATREDRLAGYTAEDCWLHLEPCETPRSTR